MTAHLIKPARLRPGDRIAIVAPAGPVPRDRFASGLALLAARYRPQFGEALFTRTGFLAGDDDRRLSELLAALADPSIRAILCARGGHGLTRLLSRLPASALRADPRPILGFSDVTALHGACLCAGLASLHGPVVTQLGSVPGGATDVIARLEDPAPQPAWTHLASLAPGRAEGIAVGGNLEVLTRLVGTPWFPVAERTVLFLEEVTERPYRIDRALTHLRNAGVFERVVAVVVGSLVGCDESDGSISGSDVMANALGSLGVPVVASAPFGHDDDNRCFVHGGRVLVDGSAGTVEFLDGAVA